MRLRLALLVPVALCAALQASAAELTFQRLVAPGGSVLARRTVLSPDARHLYAVSAHDAGRHRRLRARSHHRLARLRRGARQRPRRSLRLHVARRRDRHARRRLRHRRGGRSALRVPARRGGRRAHARRARDRRLRRAAHHLVGARPVERRRARLRRNHLGPHLPLRPRRDDRRADLRRVHGRLRDSARHFNEVRALAISPDGEFVYATSADEDAITLLRAQLDQRRAHLARRRRRDHRPERDGVQPRRYALLRRRPLRRTHA